MKQNIYAIVQDLVQAGKKLVLARIIRREGSSPRDVGTQCIITPDQIIGTIGGGLLEHRVIEESRKLIESGRSQVLPFHFSSKDAAGAGMICGGNVDLFLEPVFPENQVKTNIYKKVAQSILQNRQGVLISRIENGLSAQAGDTCLFLDSKGQVTGNIQDAGIDDLIQQINANFSESANQGSFRLIATPSPDVYLFMEPLGNESKVLLFGAGHVSLFVARLAQMVGFQVTVIDDRKEFVNEERFPDSDCCLVESFNQVFDSMDIEDNTYIVIITRGHMHDRNVLKMALKTHAGYIGMIGSRRKRDMIFQSLLDEGFIKSDLNRVFSPIGLEINAETPEEIAVSIVAQLIAVRAPEKKKLIR